MDYLKFIVLQVSTDEVDHVIERAVPVVLADFTSILVEEQGWKAIHLSTHMENPQRNK